MKSNLVLSIAYLALCMGVLMLPCNAAHAQQEMGSMYYYDIPEPEIRDHYHEWQVFLEYNLQREQCQHYQDPPAGYEVRGCQVYRIGDVAQVEPKAGSPTSSYTIYFDFDKSTIRSNEKENLDRIAREIQRSNPSEVTVSGYTDRSGTSEYNQRLSERRTQAVVQALAAYGINVKVADQMSYGETNSAVPGADGLRMQENRRVVIYFNE